MIIHVLRSTVEPLITGKLVQEVLLVWGRNNKNMWHRSILYLPYSG